MAELATIASIVSAGATIAGTAISASGSIAAGKAQRQAADYEAAQLDVRAKEEQAAAQREAEQHRRRRDLALASLTNRAAASGFTATDPTALNIGDDIAEYGTLQEQLAAYGGRSRRASLEDQAEGVRVTGKARQIASRYDAATTILGGVSTLAARYGGLPTSSSRATGGNTAANYYYGYR